ncbi:MAG TPA: hypothetical protein VF820_05100 [Patescibacteria group bacterium]
MKHVSKIASLLIGLLIVGLPIWIPQVKQLGLEPLGPILGITFIVFSLFGELPNFLTWMPKLGSLLYPGIGLATFLILIPFLIPQGTKESSFFAFSPTVWAAYISIILVGISFETSTLPGKIYLLCKRSKYKPYILVPLYVIIAGLLGNILDGVSIVIISSVILLHLLPHKWVLRALFALLFGGLISNLITVAAEPTNIKFQDVLGPLLDKIHPSFWITNWPICIFGILFPAIFLAILMKKENVAWKSEETEKIVIFNRSYKDPLYIDTVLAVISGSLLAIGIILHAIFENIPNFPNIPLWALLLPAGIASLNHLFVGERIKESFVHIKEQSPVWIKLIVIFSLLWFLQNGLSSTKSALHLFLLLPNQIQYFFLVILSLASAVTDNVALAAMQGTIILGHPISVWQIRLILVLLTWAGGLTPFGCLQSLSINHRIKLSTGTWLKETPLWAALALVGGLVGLWLIMIIYPTAV